MVTACLIITAWTTGMPLWASITTTVIAGIRGVFALAIEIAKTMD